MKKPLLKFSVILLFLFLFVNQTVKADWYPVVRNYSRQMYASGPQNWDVIQLPNNWLYFANDYGLLEYDGENWITNSVSNGTSVRCIHYLNGNIYVGAHNEFGYFKPNENGLYYNSLLPKLDKSIPTEFGNVWRILQIDSALYFQTEESLLKYKNNEFQKEFKFDGRIGYSGSFGNTICVTTQDKIYFINHDEIEEIESPELSHKIIIKIVCMDDKVLFITASNGIYEYYKGKFSPFKTNVDDQLSKIQTFTADATDKYLALGTISNGLFVIDKTGKLYTRMDMKSGLSNNTILTVKFDKAENLWLGLDNGLDYVALNYPISELYRKATFYGKGTASCLKDGILYLGTNEGVFYTKYPVDMRNTQVDLKLVSGTDGQAWCLKEMNGELFCFHNRGMFIIRGTRAEKVKGVIGCWTGELFEKDKNKMLIGTYNNLGIVEKVNGVWQYKSDLKGFKGTSKNFFEDGQYIWFSHYIKGVYRFTLNDQRDSIIETELYDKSRGLPFDQYNGISKIEGKVCINTLKGVYYYNELLDSMMIHEKYTEAVGGERGNSVLMKYKDEFWFVSDWIVGNSRYNDINKNFDVDLKTGKYFEKYMIAGFEHINPISDSCTIVGSEQGFTCFNSKKRETITGQLHLSLRWVRIFNNNQDSIIYRQSYLPQKTEEKILPYKYNTILFQYAGNEIGYYSDVQYSYKLEGFDKDWSPYTEVIEKKYEHLHEGDYVFKVRALGFHSNEPVCIEYAFTIRPPWYRSLFAYIVYILLLATTIFLIIRQVRKRTLEKQRAIIAQQEEELKLQKERFDRANVEKEKEIFALQSENLKSDLKNKTAELSAMILNVVDKNTILNNIKNELLDISDLMKNADEQGKKRMKKLISMISENLERDDYWKKFEENFNDVHDSFFKKLTEKYPSISKTDRKLCVFLKMDLSTKEIAQLMNISYRGVEVARYRLRKKLDLDRNDNLVDFLRRL